MDFYVILGLERGASLGDIKRAYKRLARKCHPDINPGDRMAAAQFRQVARRTKPSAIRIGAVATIRSAASASSLDEATFGFEGFDFSVSVSGASASTFGDLFADVLQARAFAAGTWLRCAAPIFISSIGVSFEEAMRGGQHAVHRDAAGALPGVRRHRRG